VFVSRPFFLCKFGVVRHLLCLPCWSSLFVTTFIWFGINRNKKSPVCLNAQNWKNRLFEADIMCANIILGWIYRISQLVQQLTIVNRSNIHLTISINVKPKVPIETNNTLFLQGSEILKSENSMLEKIQKGAQILYCSP